MTKPSSIHKSKLTRFKAIHYWLTVFEINMKKFINEDHKKGIKYLLNESRERKYNIKQLTWVLPVSAILAERKICLSFWKNVLKNHNFNYIERCHSFDDMSYGPYFLFSWSDTNEGFEFWESNMTRLINEYKQNFRYYGWE